MKKILVSVVKAWVHENNPKGKEKLSIASGVSLSMINGILRGEYPHNPNQNTVDGLERAIGKPVTRDSK